MAFISIVGYMEFYQLLYCGPYVHHDTSHTLHHTPLDYPDCTEGHTAHSTIVDKILHNNPL